MAETVTSPMPRRRKHLKSRDGCLQCKRRKVKCDENQTSTCRPCVKSRLLCSFVPPVLPPVSPISGNSLVDLELMYNFTTKTAISISDGHNAQSFFSTTCVELGFRYDYLLHTILALSAFHMAYQQGSKPTGKSEDSSKLANTYLQAAHRHYDSALHGYRESLSDVNMESCHPVFGCACLLFITYLAQPHEVDHAASELELHIYASRELSSRLSEWIILIRGLPSILGHNESREVLRNGPLAAIMRAYPKSKPGVKRKGIDDVEESYLNSLSGAIRDQSDHKVNETCQAAIEKLRDALNQGSSTPDAMLAFSWPMLVHQDYVVLLESQCSEALLILAYYCVLLYSSSSRWWNNKWPRSILKLIKATLNSKWMPWLKWPLQKVFADNDCDITM
jgi:hypothetical protein